MTSSSLINSRKWPVFQALMLLLVGLAAILASSRQSMAQPEGGGAIQAIEEKASPGGRSGTAEGQGKTGPSTPKFSTTQKKNVTTSTSKTTRTTPRTVTGASNTKYDVVGDKYSFLNFEIAEKVQPIWTIKAKNAGALGLVQVEVLVDENGYVLSARARTGNPLLHPEAERAALSTRFNKPTADGRPARAMGFIVYRFGTEEQEYEQEQKNKRNPDKDDGEGVWGPFDGGVLNGKAISLPKPAYPPPAKAAGAQGKVIVQVIVNENGNVTSAYALSGDQLLRDAAEQAARSAKFSPVRPSGKPAIMYGTLLYNFTP